MTTLLVDAGGTNIRFAWTDRNQRVWGEQTLTANTFGCLTEALKARCNEDRITPDTAIVAVAGPVNADEVRFTNRSWHFSQQQLKKDLQLKQLVVMNDFAAVALALPGLRPDQLDVIATGCNRERNVMLAVGPGTGLGIASVVPHGNSWIALPGEGGHSAAALDHVVPLKAQQKLWESGWLSWEAVLSGPGLVRLHAALDSTNILPAAELVTAAAASGDESARSTLSCFAALLGRRAANAALLTGAWGGIFLAGGMIKAMGDQFDRAAFFKGFETNGPFAEKLRRIPVAVITEPYPAFSGLIYAASLTDQ